MEPVYLVAAARTPIGSFQGQFSALSATHLASVILRHLVEGLPEITKHAIDEIILGTVLSAGQGQAPARQAARGAGIPDAIGALTINKVCGSGLKSVMLAASSIRAGDNHLILAGGMESMTQAPYLLTEARSGYRLGHQQVLDSLIWDGLLDPYHHTHMGISGELCAKTHGFTREQQDAYALQSYARARAAIEDGCFASEIVPVAIPSKKGDALLLSSDEEPFKNDLAKFPNLRPAFESNGSITAGNASKLNDGAAAVLVASTEAVRTHALAPIGKILGYSTHSQSPEWFTTAPVGAIEKLLIRLDKTVSDISVFEINEAFAIVPMFAQAQLNIPTEKLNPRGGAIALGHPLGASGARILVTLLHTLSPGDIGIASLCIGGGEAVAMAVEKL